MLLAGAVMCAAKRTRRRVAMSTHYRRSIDYEGLWRLAVDAREVGATKIQNKAFATLVKAAVTDEVHLTLTQQTHDPDGRRTPEDSINDLICVTINRSGRRLRAPLAIFNEQTQVWLVKAIGSDYTEKLEFRGRGRKQDRRPSDAELRALEMRLTQFAEFVPTNMLKDRIEGRNTMREPVLA